MLLYVGVGNLLAMNEYLKQNENTISRKNCF